MFPRALARAVSIGARGAAAAAFPSAQPMRPVVAATTVSSRFYTSPSKKIFAVNTIADVPGARKQAKRVGRGRGSGLGKMSGFGHQKSRSTPFGFEGGQTPLYKRLPKIGFNNFRKREFVPVNVGKIQEYVDMKRLVPKEKDVITIRDLYECGLVHNVRDGVKLLASVS